MRRGLKHYHCCERCLHLWHDVPWPLVCPSCKALIQWIVSFRFPEDAERHAGQLTAARAVAAADHHRPGGPTP